MTTIPVKKTLAIVVYGPFDGIFVNELCRLQKQSYDRIVIVAITWTPVPTSYSINAPLEIGPKDLRQVRERFDTVIVAPSRSCFIPPLGALLKHRTGSRILVKVTLLNQFAEEYKNHEVLGF